MSRSVDSISERLPNRVVRAYDRETRANVYAVAHLRQYIGDRDLGTFRTGDREIYEKAAYSFVRDLSRELKGKRAYRRSKPSEKRFPNVITPERGLDLPHLNINIQRPDWIPFAFFKEAMEVIWFDQPWAATGGKAFFCEERSGDCIGYSTKEGNEAVLLAPLSFDCRYRRLIEEAAKR